MAMPILPLARVNPSQMRPPLVSCATSQNVMPALGKRSEMGMKAEPMMPKECSMPCICRTFTKASSVVIFMVVFSWRRRGVDEPAGWSLVDLEVPFARVGECAWAALSPWDGAAMIATCGPMSASVGNGGCEACMVTALSSSAQRGLIRALAGQAAEAIWRTDSMNKPVGAISCSAREATIRWVAAGARTTARELQELASQERTR